MMHSRPLNSGFSFIEILLALSIASALLVPVFILQGRILKTINYYATTMQAILYMESFFNKQQLEAEVDNSNTQITVEKKIEEPELTIQYERKRVPPGSSLSKIDAIYLEKITAQWTDLRGPQKETMISFIFKAEQKAS